jgi:hypothetical protein
VSSDNITGTDKPEEGTSYKLQNKKAIELTFGEFNVSLFLSLSWNSGFEFDDYISIFCFLSVGYSANQFPSSKSQDNPKTCIF